MKKLKIVFMILAATMLLSVGSPAIAGTQAAQSMPPAVVFTIDAGNRMLLKHNFDGDGSMYVPGKSVNDPGFYINIPQN